MTDPTDRSDRLEAKQCMANAAAQAVRGTLVFLERAGWPADAILAGAHAEIVALMAACLGGKEAAASCERAAERVRDLPPAPMPDPLATAAPMGRA